MAEKFWPVRWNCILRVQRNTLSEKTIYENSDFFSSSADFWTNIYRAWQKTFQQGNQNWNLQSSCHKINQKLKLLKLLFHFAFFRTLNEHFRCLAKNFSAGISNWKLHSSSHKIKQKIKLLKNLYFFQNLHNFERKFTVLGEKILCRDIKNENCTLCLQSIMLGIKINFWKFCKFSFISDMEHKKFGFVATEFSSGLSKCILGVYMNSLRDVGIRSEITWRETSLEF